MSAPTYELLSPANISRVEHEIAPPMRSAITIPVMAHAGARGMEVAIYVSTSMFGQRGVAVSDTELRAIAKDIAQRLQESQNCPTIGPDNTTCTRTLGHRGDCRYEKAITS